MSVKYCSQYCVVFKRLNPLLNSQVIVVFISCHASEKTKSRMKQKTTITIRTRQSTSGCISSVQYSIDIVTLATVTSSVLLPSMDYHFYFFRYSQCEQTKNDPVGGLSKCSEQMKYECATVDLGVDRRITFKWFYLVTKFWLLSDAQINIHYSISVSNETRLQSVV